MPSRSRPAHAPSADSQPARSRTSILAAALVLALVAVAIVAWRANVGALPPPPTVIPPLTVAGATVLVGAGDIAQCGDADDEATAALVEAIPGTVFLAGDNAYPDGSVRDYTRCYGSSWGRFRDRTRPAPRDHGYPTEDAAGYLEFFG